MDLNTSQCVTAYNTSSGNPSVSSDFVTILQIVGAIILILGLVLNFLFLLTILFNKHLRNVPNIFLVNLCASNLVYIGTVVIGYAVIGGMEGTSVSVCQTVGSFSVLYDASYCLTLVAVGFYHYRKVYTLRKRKTYTILCLFGLTWLLTALIVVISLVTNSAGLYMLCNVLCLMKTEGNFCECINPGSKQAHVQAFDLLFIFSLVALILTYALLLWTLNKSTKKTGFGNQVCPSIHTAGTKGDKRSRVEMSQSTLNSSGASRLSTSANDFFHDLDDISAVANNHDHKETTQTNHEHTHTLSKQLRCSKKILKPGDSKLAIKIHIKTVQRGLMIVVIYTISFLPSMLLSLNNFTISNLQQNESMAYILLCTFVFHGLNVIFCPLLYFIFDKTVRKSFFRLFSKCRINDPAICQIFPTVE